MISRPVLPVYCRWFLVAVLLSCNASAALPIVDHLQDDGFEVLQPVLYPPDRVHSPLSPGVLAGLLKFTDGNGVIQDDVFARAGDTKMVSTRALNCFGGDNIDLGAYAGLQATLTVFQNGDAALASPFDRASQAVGIGRTAPWLVTGNPSPLEEEFTTIWPRFTLIAFGENDMAFPSPDTFVTGLLDAIDFVQRNGSVPVIYSVVPCQDCPGDPTDVERYRNIARATTQFRQVPFIDLYFALDPLPDDGLTVDGVNMNVYNNGNNVPCVFSASGLDFGYNMFNLVSLQALDRLRRALVEGEPAPDTVVNHRTGTGRMADPVIVDRFPYGDGRYLGATGPDDVDDFAACSGPDTVGPEVIYRLEVASNSTLQVDLMSRGDADLDIWLFSGGLAGTDCVAYENSRLETAVTAGTWYIVIESWLSGADPQNGEYVISIDLD